MKTKIIVVLIFWISLSLTSCVNDILDKGPQDIYGDKDLWNSPQLIDAYVVNIYSSSRFGGILRDNEMVELITTTDEAICGLAYSNTHSINRGTLTATDGFNQYWDYELIRKMNFFLENYKSSPLDPGYLEVRAGEVRFLRAFAYFEMVKRYGGVPLLTRVQAVDEGADLYLSRNTEEEIYDFIISECEVISKTLPEEFTGTDDGRITRYVALSLLSRAALYAASIAEYGTALTDPNGRVGIAAGRASVFYDKSLHASDEIMKSGKFQLYNKLENKADNYQQLFLDNNTNPEVIFWKKYVPKLSGHNFDWNQTKQKVTLAISAEMINSYDMVDGSPKVIDFEHAVGSLNELLVKKDPRLHASVLWNGGTWRNIEIKSYKGVIDEIDGVEVKMTDRNKEYKGIPQQGIDFCENMATGFTVRKYLDPSVEVPLKDESGTDYAMFRYAEILLNKAEAAFKLNSKAEALDALNQIRKRAGVLPLTTVDMQKIMDERKIELAFEEHRFYDIRRWRIAEEVIAQDLHAAYAYYDFRINNYVYDFFPAGNAADNRKFLKNHYYLPIMPGRISNNPNLTENPGYN